MKIKQETVEVIKDFCECFDYEFRTDYSGRGMYGGQCIGIVASESLPRVAFQLAVFLYENLSELEFEEVSEAIQKEINQDSMGLSSILYFPRIQWTEKDVDNE